MRFLPMIALLALLGCAGNKPVAEQKTLPTCEEFYDFHERFAKRIDLELDSVLIVLENPVKWRSCPDGPNLKCDCQYNIVCDGKSYCVDPMF
jgi:hypothetical protein